MQKNFHIPSSHSRINEMVFNPSPKVAAARKIGQRFNKKVVIVIMLDDDTIEYASYGETMTLCHRAAKIADVIYNTVIDFLRRNPE